MDRLSTVLPTVLRRRGLAAHAEGALVLHRASLWIAEKNPLLGPLVAIQHLKDGILTIGCTHSSALQECQELHVPLRDYLHIECPFAVIREIRVTRM